MSPNKLMKNTLRKKETQKKYKDYLENEYDGACIFCQCNQKIKEFKYWILHSQKFPYDNLGVKINNHFMLAPKRHIEHEIEINNQEIIELHEIEQELDYDMRILNSKSKQSIPSHLHYHYIKFDTNN